MDRHTEYSEREGEAKVKVEVEVVKVLVVSIHLLFQIFLKTFLVILVVEDQIEDLVIEVTT